MAVLDIKQESYFPFTFKLFGLIAISFGFLIWTQREMLFILKALIMFGSVLVGLLMATARHGLWIKPKSRTYCEYVWLLGWKVGKVVTYAGIEKIFINEVTDEANVQARSGLSYTVRDMKLKAFLKFDDGKKIHMDTDKNKDKIEARVRRYRETLGVPNH